MEMETFKFPLLTSVFIFFSCQKQSSLLTYFTIILTQDYSPSSSALCNAVESSIG